MTTKVRCEVCAGQGVVLFERAEVRCPDCDGDGWILDPDREPDEYDILQIEG